MGILRLLSSSALLLALTAVGASADVSHERHEPVGKVRFEVSCAPGTQEQFDYAMALLHSFFYPETVKAFTKVAELDPTCAMAYWGVAQAYRQNPLIAGAALEKEAWAAVEKGLATGTKTQRERDWLAAVEVLFRDYDKVPYGERVKAYTRAMERLAAAHPEDTEAQIYYALALNESADLADTTLANQRKAGELLERLWPRLPEHPGVAHYLIHTYDYPQLAERGLPVARAYAALAPASPHAKHMPSHVFSMAGMWEDVAKADEAARAAWVEYGAKAFGGAATGELHSMDFLTYAYLQTARDRKAGEMVDLPNGITKIAAKRLPTYTAYAAIPVRYALERDDWAGAAALELPAIEPIATEFPQALAIGHFGRALGAVRPPRRRGRGYRPARGDPEGPRGEGRPLLGAAGRGAGEGRQGLDRVCPGPEGRGAGADARGGRPRGRQQEAHRDGEPADPDARAAGGHAARGWAAAGGAQGV